MARLKNKGVILFYILPYLYLPFKKKSLDFLILGFFILSLGTYFIITRKKDINYMAGNFINAIVAMFSLISYQSFHGVDMGNILKLLLILTLNLLIQFLLARILKKSGLFTKID